jgi:hypothetical protein
VVLNSPNNLVEDKIVIGSIIAHRTVGDGRVGSYAEPKAAGLSKAGWHVVMMQGGESCRGELK